MQSASSELLADEPGTRQGRSLLHQGRAEEAPATTGRMPLHSPHTRRGCFMAGHLGVVRPLQQAGTAAAPTICRPGHAVALIDVGVATTVAPKACRATTARRRPCGGGCRCRHGCRSGRRCRSWIRQWGPRGHRQGRIRVLATERPRARPCGALSHTPLGMALWVAEGRVARSDWHATGRGRHLRR